LNIKKKKIIANIDYPAKQSFIIVGEIKTIHNKQRLNKFMTTKSPLQKILKEILHSEDEDKYIHQCKHKYTSKQ
jgi:hypothetical protein